MIYLLVLLASLVQAQEASTSTAIPLLDQIQISNLGKDTRDLLSGRYRQTGKPTFAGGLCFADGTCQTTAASGSDSVAHNFTAAITFSSSVYGACYRLSYSSFSAVTIAASPSVLVSSRNWFIDINAVQNTATGIWYLQFNGDSGANYTSHGRTELDNGSTSIQNSGAVAGAYIVGPNLPQGIGFNVTGQARFRTVWGSPKVVRVNSSMEMKENSVPAAGTQNGGGTYTGAANLSSVALGTTGGTMTGYFEIWDCGPWALTQ